MINEKIFYVYIYLNPLKPGKFIYDNLIFDYEPFYVGKGKGKRMYFHYNEKVLNLDKNKHKVNIIKQILNSNNLPTVIKLYNNLTEEEAFNHEINLIKKIGRSDVKTGTLTNLTKGGDGCSGHIWQFGRELSDETKEKISNTLKNQGRWLGDNNPSKTKEHRELMSKLLKGRFVSDETKNKISLKSTGRKYSEKVTRDRSFKRSRLNKKEFLDKVIFIIENNMVSVNVLISKTGFSKNFILVIKRGKHWVNKMTVDELIKYRDE